MILLAFIVICVGACSDKRQQPRALSGADAEAGLEVMKRVGCAACHDIPGVDWPRGAVGGSLAGFADRSMIAGRLPNQPQTVALWVRNAPSLAPTTGMPAMPITPSEARDVAAYLYTLEND